MSRLLVVIALLLGACKLSTGSFDNAKSPPTIVTSKPVAAVAPARSPEVVDQDFVMPVLPRARVTLFDVYQGRHAVEVEVAATTPARTRGLMWRTELAANAGMLFIFPTEQPLTFWMKNTLIPLDMLFIKKDGTVAGIVENAVPQTLSPRGVADASTFVLEVAGGWCAERKIRAGSKVLFEQLQNILPE